jgi:hypothetical protein
MRGLLDFYDVFVNIIKNNFYFEIGFSWCQ